ncbi:hypothetical protein JZ751_007427 [Albula glossodonta]|uniref:Uncharacterized protein n=1 Tax=Albula glossodonta TaxID=121402 RepID=A0A8T2N2E0_9TELE|nr:hypothetical protein JZ751_007427 [Albula glossodonta]
MWETHWCGDLGRESESLQQVFDCGETLRGAAALCRSKLALQVSTNSLTTDPQSENVSVVANVSVTPSMAPPTTSLTSVGAAKDSKGKATTPPTSSTHPFFPPRLLSITCVSPVPDNGLR